jgi:DNA-directed RNA polymerase subunit K/omega
MDTHEDEDYDQTIDLQTAAGMHKFEDIKELTLNYEALKNGYKNKIKKITKYELPTIIGFRATQIANGSPVLVEVPDYMTDTLQIAEYEFKKGATPFIIKKRVGTGFEYWKLEDLTHNLIV